VNEAHEYCGSDEWRQMIREVILPWVLGETDLGDDVLEVGPGYGATTDVLGTLTTRLRSVEIDDDLAARLRERFADSPSVEIIDGDATRLEFADDTFTGAACFTMLHHVPTIELQAGCSPKWRECCALVRRWSPATALAATILPAPTRATPTTRSIPRRYPSG
jgi:ubiquinone/menaquinone biosynthesis C-methylase UbiE